MVLPLIPILAGLGILTTGAAAGAGIAGLTAGKKESTIQTTNTSTYQPSSVYSPQITTTTTLAPQTTTTTTTSRVNAPQYLFSPSYVISSPYGSTSGSTQTGASTALKTDLKATAQTNPTVTPNQTATATPSVSVAATKSGGGGLFEGGELGSLMLLGGAAFVVYYVFLKK